MCYFLSLYECFFLEYGFTEISRLLAFGIGRGYKEIHNNDSEIMNYFFGKSTPEDIKNMTIDNDNVIKLLDFFSTALMEYSIFKLTHIRVSKIKMYKNS